MRLHRTLLLATLMVSTSLLGHKIRADRAAENAKPPGAARAAFSDAVRACVPAPASSTGVVGSCTEKKPEPPILAAPAPSGG